MECYRWLSYNGKTGCPSCSGVVPWTLERFLLKAQDIHGEKYNYTFIKKEDIKGRESYILIKCFECQYEWCTTIHIHINSRSGCPDCSGKVPWTLDRFLVRAKVIHGNKYDYSFIKKEDIKGEKSYISIKCTECKYEWNTTTVGNHIYGKNGCPTCVIILFSKGTSKTEQAIVEAVRIIYEINKETFLQSHYTISKTTVLCSNEKYKTGFSTTLKPDIHIQPSNRFLKRIFIEYDGWIGHSEEYGIQKDKAKTRILLEGDESVVIRIRPKKIGSLGITKNDVNTDFYFEYVEDCNSPTQIVNVVSKIYKDLVLLF